MNKKSIPATWCKSHKIAVQIENSFCRVFTENCADELLLEKLRNLLNTRVIPQKATLGEINRKNREQESQNSEVYLNSLPSSKKISSWESEPIINLVDDLLEQAFEKKASDIHIEPQEKCLRIRIRQDGLLIDFKTLPLWLAEPVLIRLKILSSVDITDKRIPHDGSFEFNSSFGSINVRLSTLPVQGGEKCVLRLLSRQHDIQENKHSLDDLIINKKQLDFIRNVFKKPQGLFLVTGPTGSGKSTTLHAGLKEIIHKQINITTIEDPIEYTLEGANQVQINERCGFTFPVALRSILRQDPDVILIGEIRDAETAQIAVRAAQTGHLVLSTLHTNNSKSVPNRLKDLGIEKHLIQDTLLGAMAQRLVRKKDFHSTMYSGRIAITEITRGDGTLVDGCLEDCARDAISKGLTDEEEIARILGEIP